MINKQKTQLSEIKIITNHHTAPEQEQQLCLKCGMCCNGTLYSMGAIKNEDDKKVVQSLNMTINKEDSKKFNFPCPHFLINKNACNVYDQKRPSVCETFRCKLLRKIDSGDISKDAGLKIINTAHRLQAEFIDAAKQTGNFSDEQLTNIKKNIPLFIEEKMDLSEFNAFAKMSLKLASCVLYLRKYFLLKT